MNLMELLGKIGEAVANGTSPSEKNSSQKSEQKAPSVEAGATTLSAPLSPLKTNKTKRETVEDMLRRHAALSMKIDAASSAATNSGAATAAAKAKTAPSAPSKKPD